MKCLVAILLAFGLAAGAYAADAGSLVQRGHYLTRLGDCRACHTEPGRAAFSGGVPIDTPFGVIYSPNITPDKKTGIGDWTFDNFYRAMHEGIDKDGDYLYPAFPFPSYTHLTRKDVKAIWAYLRTVQPVERESKTNTLRWPYSMDSAMRVWRALYFEPHTFEPDPKAPAMQNRGAYLVRALTHCGACHTPRNGWGALQTDTELAGGTIPVEGWYAPNITPNPHIGIGDWSPEALRSFLVTGRSKRGDALGPMRDVVESSLQYLTPEDLTAVTTYLQSIPAIGPQQPIAANTAPPINPDKPPLGMQLYGKHCAGCHGDDGHAKHPWYPDLRDNAVVLDPNPTNLVLMIIRGGFQTATRDHPYPYSMPPFGFKLSDKDIAAIANFVRRDWSRRDVPQIEPKHIATMR